VRRAKEALKKWAGLEAQHLRKVDDDKVLAWVNRAPPTDQSFSHATIWGKIH
jgi:hypothetical protein